MNQSPEQKRLRAARLKKLRKMTHHSRKAFSEKYGISQGTLQNWETARFGGLTEKGAHTMIAALGKEGLFCSFEWLMYGVGNSPVLTTHSEQKSNTPTQTEIKSEEERIDAQLQLFCDLNPNTLNLQIQDNTMEPYFEPGQVVAGKKRIGKDIEKLLNRPCIIELEDNHIVLRYLRKGAKPNSYHMVCLNKDAHVEEPFVYNAQIISAAPITWVRTIDA